MRMNSKIKYTTKYISKRDLEITSLVLKGETYHSVSKKFRVSPQRIRQFVNRACDRLNKDLYKIMPESTYSKNRKSLDGKDYIASPKTVNSKWLREHKDMFLEIIKVNYGMNI